MALTRRQRRAAFRGAQYALLLGVVAIAVFTANWDELHRAFFDLNVAAKQFPRIVTIAMSNTIVFTAMGFTLGLVLGLVLALMRLSSVGPYRWLSRAYIEFFRGLPALLVFIAIGFGIPLAFHNVRLDRNLSITLALGVVASAYMAETIRAGIQAVPRGQVEAGRSLGMSSAKTTIAIVIPQGFRIMLPPLTNELIMLTKDSSLAYLLGSTVSQQELAQFSRQALLHDQSLTPLVVAGLCYLAITIPLSILQLRLERRFGGGGTTTPGLGG
jgi:polar amino acid transport system permease protein